MSGLKNFSVGADLKERKIMSKSESHNALEIFNNCFNAIEDLDSYNLLNKLLFGLR